MATTNFKNPALKPRPTIAQTALVVAIFVLMGVAYWFLLPYVQMLFLPSNGPAAEGPWVIRPILAAHAGAMAMMTCATMPLVILILKRLEILNPPDSDFHRNALARNPVWYVLVVLKVSVLLLVYFSALVFYLFSWSTVGPEGIEEHLPWTTHQYAYEDVESLRIRPQGKHSQNGPSYAIRFANNDSWDFSLDNEGLTQQTVDAIASMIESRSGVEWQKVPDRRR